MMNWKIAGALVLVVSLAIILPQLYCMCKAKKSVIFTPITKSVPVENVVPVEKQDTYIQDQTNKQMSDFVDKYNDGHAYSDSIELGGKIESLEYLP